MTRGTDVATQRRRARARRLRLEHDWPFARIARKLDVDVGTVRRWCADLRDPDPNARRYDRAAILADARPPTAMSRAALLEKYGCSPRFLSDLLNGKLKP